MHTQSHKWKDMGPKADFFSVHTQNFEALAMVIRFLAAAAQKKR